MLFCPKLDHLQEHESRGTEVKVRSKAGHADNIDSLGMTGRMMTGGSHKSLDAKDRLCTSQNTCTHVYEIIVIVKPSRFLQPY